jgi:hypothetical protein
MIRKDIGLSILLSTLSKYSGWKNIEAGMILVRSSVRPIALFHLSNLGRGLHLG